MLIKDLYIGLLLVFLVSISCSDSTSTDDDSNTDDDPATVTDIDGNVYNTVKIGNQLWLAENLKVTRYSNGDPIPKVTDNAQWESLTTGAYCEYMNDSSNASIYGYLYNWYAVNDSRGLAPKGWHVHTSNEWGIMQEHLGHNGGKLKETGTNNWEHPNEGATNESGFSALPGGFRDLNGVFGGMGYTAFFWTSTEPYESGQGAEFHELHHNSIDIPSIFYYNEPSMYSIKNYKNSYN
jgi:uncharacterized protein (TIGR02145 family)